MLPFVIAVIVIIAFIVIISNIQVVPVSYTHLTLPTKLEV